MLSTARVRERIEQIRQSMEGPFATPRDVDKVLDLLRETIGADGFNPQCAVPSDRIPGDGAPIAYQLGELVRRVVTSSGDNICFNFGGGATASVTYVIAPAGVAAHALVERLRIGLLELLEQVATQAAASDANKPCRCSRPQSS